MFLMTYLQLSAKNIGKIRKLRKAVTKSETLIERTMRRLRKLGNSGERK